MNNEGEAMFIGIDVGGTAIKYGVILRTGEIVKKGQMPTIHEKEKFLQSVTALIESLQQDAVIEGVGISAPGIIQKDGTMITAGSIKPLYGINLKLELEKRVKLPVLVENDANAAAIAEKWLGHAQACENYLCLVVGTGIGGGIIVNNQLYRGSHGMAGEFGWMLIDTLPEQGNLESVSLNQRAAIVGGLCHQYQLALQQQGRSDLPQDAVEIFQRGEQGEVVANQVIAQFFQDLSVGLLNLISTFDPELILVGGGVSENDGFMTRLEKTMSQLKARHESIGYLEGRTIAPIQRAKLKNDAGMIGAVYQLMNQ
ncbi:ROK family protein [Enterococcus casseliflavus ATCC 12755]|uniref:ROK family protein n=2 Tax=Enterococcus casseliflavus TaxID=37734 RepID=F0EMI5_ENTCA|nr:ROK family protein [Enterococcus casseliflavus ATCC 12755]